MLIFALSNVKFVFFHHKAKTNSIHMERFRRKRTKYRAINFIRLQFRILVATGGLFKFEASVLCVLLPLSKFAFPSWEWYYANFSHH